MYTIEDTYAAGNTQRHEHLDEGRAVAGLGAFQRDLTGVGGVVRVVLYNEDAYGPCNAAIYLGPGHQSRCRCDRTGPHDQHAYRGGWFWHGDEATSGFFDESPEDEA